MQILTRWLPINFKARDESGAEHDASNGQFTGSSGGGGGSSKEDTGKESTDKPVKSKAAYKKLYDQLVDQAQLFKEDDQARSLLGWGDEKGKAAAAKIIGDIKAHVEDIKSKLSDYASEKDLKMLDKAIAKELAPVERLKEKLSRTADKCLAADKAYEDAKAVAEGEEVADDEPEAPEEKPYPDEPEEPEEIDYPEEPDEPDEEDYPDEPDEDDDPDAHAQWKEVCSEVDERNQQAKEDHKTALAEHADECKAIDKQNEENSAKHEEALVAYDEAKEEIDDENAVALEEHEEAHAEWEKEAAAVEERNAQKAKEWAKHEPKLIAAQDKANDTHADAAAEYESAYDEAEYNVSTHIETLLDSTLDALPDDDEKKSWQPWAHVNRISHWKGWNEQDHDRADNGEFGSGGGGSADSTAKPKPDSKPIDKSFKGFAPWGRNGTHAQPQKKAWSESDHDRADNGQFGSGGGGSGATGETAAAPAPKATAGTASVLGRLKAASSHAGKILAASVKVPLKAVGIARKASKAVMNGIEKRYGKRVKQAVSVAVLLSLPVPVPGMSAIVAAPIIAFAELHRQILGSKAATQGDISEEKLKQLVRHVLSKMFPGKLPSEIDPEAAFKENQEADDAKRWEPITKRYPDIKRRNAGDEIQIATFDDSKMYAKSVISTDQLDRDNEIMIPKGLDLANFTAYAPWFLDHQGQDGGGPPMFPFPIGSAKAHPLDPDCPPDVWIGTNSVSAGCYFNDKTAEARCTYELWKIGHMGATSVGFESDPPTVETLHGREAEERYGVPAARIHHKWKLCEISIVGLGANREALREHAARGTINKQAIPDSMKRWFSQFVVRPKTFRAQPVDGVGFTTWR